MKQTVNSVVVCDS